MAITKAEIFKIVHERLNSINLARRVISIDNDLRDCLYELTNDVNLLLTATTVTTTASTATKAIPTGLRSWYVVAIDGGNFLDSGDMADYEKSIEGVDTPSTGEPTKICEFDGNFYFYDPIPDTAYTVRIYGVLEEDDVADIDLADRCREALVWGVLYRLFVGGELLPDPDDKMFAQKLDIVVRQQQNCFDMYRTAKEALRRSVHSEPTLIKYHDI